MNNEKDVRIRVAELIQVQYRARGLKRGDFATQLGVTDRAVGYWLDGTSKPKAELRPHIEKMFGWASGSITKAMLDGMSGKPLDQIQMSPADEPAESVDELAGDQPDGKPLEGVPASDLADELVNRLRAAEDEVLSLRRQLEDTQRSLRKAQRDGSRP